MADLSVARFVSNFGQFLKFGIVGGSGTAVNLITSVLAKKWGWACFEAMPNDPLVNLLSLIHI